MENCILVLMMFLGCSAAKKADIPRVLASTSSCSFELREVEDCFERANFFDIDACSLCILEGQPDPENPVCQYIACADINECRFAKCGSCASEVKELFNCRFEKQECGINCYDQYSTCSAEVGVANDCQIDLQSDQLEINECVMCASISQPDPSWGTCDMIDCEQVHECLVNSHCSECADEWMGSFSCTWIEIWGCSDYDSCSEFGYDASSHFSNPWGRQLNIGKVGGGNGPSGM